jgi:hypothetical protein
MTRISRIDAMAIPFPSGFVVVHLTARHNSLVNNLDHPRPFDQLILRDHDQNATQIEAALPPEDA